MGHVQGHLTYYEEYAALLAQWGYAVVQYDIACSRWFTPKHVPWPQLDNINDEVRSLSVQIASPLPSHG